MLSPDIPAHHIELDPSLGEFTPRETGLYLPENEGLIVTKQELVDYAGIVRTAYEPNADALDRIARARLVTVTAPRGMGKDSTRRATGYPCVVSFTTREIRECETDGIDYHFVQPGDYGHLISAIRQGRLLQYNTGIAGNEVYGTLPSEYSEDKPNILDVMSNQIQPLRALPFKSLVSVYLVAPFDDWVTRWNGRGAMSDEDKQKSFEEAAESLGWALSDEEVVFVHNAVVEKTAARVRTIAERPSMYTRVERRTARHMGAQLFERIKEELTLAA